MEGTGSLCLWLLKADMENLLGNVCPKLQSSRLSDLSDPSHLS